jgi:uncharacterized protein DUF5753/helix-turn-helix protein
MKDRESTVRSRALGAALADAMKTKMWTVSRAAHAVGWSESRVSRLVSGRRGVPVADVATLLAVLDVRGERRTELLAVAEDLFRLGWLQEHGQQPPEPPDTLAQADEAAAIVTTYQAAVLPVLLQTTGYAAEVARAAGTPVDDERITARLSRQALLSRWPRPELRFFVDEHVVTHAGAEREMMSEQVHHLLRLAIRPNVAIRVVPTSAGLVCGCPAFELFEFHQNRPVVHVEHLAATAFLERPETVAEHRAAIAHLGRVALSEVGSRVWLTTLASAFGDLDELDSLVAS